MSDGEHPALDESIAPGFLIAGPHLPDPNFSGSLVLMAQHTDEGALGFVVNQPATIDLETLLESIDEDLAAAAKVAGLAAHDVLVGGPVQQTALWILFERTEEDDPDELLEVGEHVVLGASFDLLEAFASGRRPGPFHVLLGYAGWGPLQLEKETAAGAWLPLKLEEDLIFEVPFENRWDEAVKRLGLPPGGFLIGGPGAKA